MNLCNNEKHLKIKVIVISGTPGTGKTNLAKQIAKKSDFKYLNIKKIIKKYNLHEYFDKKRKCLVVDTNKLNKILIDLIKNSKYNLVIDSHLSHFLPRKYVSLCIITKCNLKILRKRLIKRKYNKLKIKENLESEIFNICLNEEKELGNNILVIDTTKRIKNLNINSLISLSK